MFINPMHNSKQLSTFVSKNMFKQQSNQALLVLFPSKKHHDEAIDLSLRLNIITTSTTNDMNFKNSKNSKNSKKRMMCTSDQENSMQAKRLKRFSFYTMEEEAEEKLKGVSTKLKLFNDPWKIKKVLEQSDVNKLCRLMISKRLVQQHIVKVWERAGKYEDVRELEDRNGVAVKVWDCNRGEEYVLTMKKHSCTDCYIFCTNWRSQFVSERGLKKGDKIGLFWCNLSESFFFSVLGYAPD